MEALARRFTDGTNGRPDPAFGDLFAEKVRHWHSYETEEPPVVEGARMAAMFSSDDTRFAQSMPDYRKDERLFVGDDGFALVRMISGTMPDGRRVFTPHCIVATVEDGRIVRTDVYVDKAQHDIGQQAMRPGNAAAAG
jgi:ketosteroid isomerase-like protein